MLLAVDTSTAQLGLALYDGAVVIAELTWTSRARHTVELAPALSGLLDRTGISIKDLAALGVAIGPGSFTSLRVGLAFVKGLALARHLPVIGVPTLDTVAASMPVQDIPLAAVLQAGRGTARPGLVQGLRKRVAGGRFDPDHERGRPGRIDPPAHADRWRVDRAGTPAAGAQAEEHPAGLTRTVRPAPRAAGRAGMGTLEIRQAG